MFVKAGRRERPDFASIASKTSNASNDNKASNASIASFRELGWDYASFSDLQPKGWGR